MNQYKHFSSSDLKKEQVGKVKAKNLKEAYIKASKKKRKNEGFNGKNAEGFFFFEFSFF